MPVTIIVTAFVAFCAFFILFLVALQKSDMPGFDYKHNDEIVDWLTNRYKMYRKEADAMFVNPQSRAGVNHLLAIERLDLLSEKLRTLDENGHHTITAILMRVDLIMVRTHLNQAQIYNSMRKQLKSPLLLQHN